MEASAPRRRLVDALWWLAAAAGILCFGFTSLRGSDLWWHLAAGRWLLEAWRWPLRDPWSFTRHGAPWLNHEWLADVVFHTWARVFGMPALVFWKWGVIASAFLLLFHTLRRVSGSAAAAFLATVAAAAVGAPFFDVRPHLYSLLGFALLLHLVLERRRASWLLPFVFLVWVNLHGGFFYGLLAASLLFFAAARARAAAFPWRVWVGCVAACVLNPHGVFAFTYPLRYAFDRSSPFRTIGEWRPPFAAGGIPAPQFFPAVFVWVAAAALWYLSGRWRERRELTIAGTLLGLLTLAMALRSRRFIPLFGISASLLLAPVLVLAAGFVTRRLTWMRAAAARPAFALAVPLIALGVSAAVLAGHPLAPRTAFRAMTQEDTFPRAMCDALEKDGTAGNVFAYYNWGGYLHLRTAGRLQVYIDGRADTVFDAETYNRYVAVLLEKPGWTEIVDSSGAGLFLWPKDEPEQVEGLLRSGRWRTVHDDGVATLLQRAGP